MLYEYLYVFNTVKVFYTLPHHPIPSKQPTHSTTELNSYVMEFLIVS